jgi:hypothetical protein
MWILTKAVNDYNQHGDYFVCAFTNKPTRKELKAVIPEADRKLLTHILNGGGRVEWEYEWYFLEELQSGQVYQHAH